MNIFFVDRDPFDAAKCLVDKHVVKMILETAQILCTAQRMHRGNMMVVKQNGRNVKKWIMDDVELNDSLYSATHVNHPSVVWAREAYMHYDWLFNHFTSLLAEYDFRYGKKHACLKLFPLLIENPCPTMLWTDPPCAMPDEYKISNDAVTN